MVQISVLSNEQQRELDISPSFDGLHFPALVSAEAHVVVENVLALASVPVGRAAVACIQFSASQGVCPRVRVCDG